MVEEDDSALNDETFGGGDDLGTDEWHSDMSAMAKFEMERHQMPQKQPLAAPAPPPVAAAQQQPLSNPKPPVMKSRMPVVLEEDDEEDYGRVLGGGVVDDDQLETFFSYVDDDDKDSLPPSRPAANAWAPPSTSAMLWSSSGAQSAQPGWGAPKPQAAPLHIVRQQQQPQGQIPPAIAALLQQPQAPQAPVPPPAIANNPILAQLFGTPQQSRQGPVATVPNGVLSAADFEAKFASRPQAQPQSPAAAQQRPVFISQVPQMRQVHEPFLRDPSESDLWKGGRKYMTEAGINEVVQSHYDLLRSIAPYADDYYRLNFLHKNKLGTGQQLQYLNQHKPLADAPTVSKKELPPKPYMLGRIPPFSTKGPRPLVQLSEEDGYYETDHIGVLKARPHYGLLVFIEDTIGTIIEIEDFDKLIVSSSSLPNIKPLQTYFHHRRTQLEEELVKVLCAKEGSFIAEILGLRKGASMFARALRALTSKCKAKLASHYIKSIGHIIFQQQHQMMLQNQGSISVDSDLRRLQLEVTQLIVETARSATVRNSADLLNAFARTYPDPSFWASLLRLPEALCVVGAVLHRGSELSMHQYSPGDDLSDKFNSMGIADDKEAQEATARAYATWHESFFYVFRCCVEALRTLAHMRMASLSGMAPPGQMLPPPPPPFPAAVWNMLVALATLANPKMKDMLRAVLSALLSVGGLEQSVSNPAMLALHNILLAGQVMPQQLPPQIPMRM